MRAATTHSSGTTLFTFTALKCAITPIHEVEHTVLGDKQRVACDASVHEDLS